jgi:hypothetical protein
MMLTRPPPAEIAPDCRQGPFIVSLTPLYTRSFPQIGHFLAVRKRGALNRSRSSLPPAL